MKILIIFTIICFMYTMFMIHQISKFAYKRSRRSRNRFIDYLEAHWNLYKIKVGIQQRKIEESRIETVEAEEVLEIERPSKFSWTVENSKRLGERFAETKLIEE